MRTVSVEFIGGPQDGLVLSVPEGTEEYYFPILSQVDWFTRTEEAKPTWEKLTYQISRTPDGYKAILQR